MIEQKLWQIETQLKRMGENDLQAIMDEFNNKIDSIFEKACSDLEKLRPKSMKANTAGKDAAITGELQADSNCFVQMTTRFGGRRMVDWLNGEQLPRIC